MRIALLSLALILFASCNQVASDKNTPVADDGQKIKVDSLIGESMDLEKAQPIAMLNASFEPDPAELLVVEGAVTDVCSKKGCWMKLDQGNGETVRVTFKDYALFMPLDLAGSKVVVRGIAKKDTVSVDDLRHYAEDAGKSAEEIAAITEPEIKISFEADGVAILR
jgi:hypothetical protein